MPENHNPSTSDHAIMEMNHKVDIILVELKKIQKVLTEYKEKHPDIPISQETLEQFVQNMDSFNPT